MPISRQSCGPLGKAPELEKDMFQETISRARALLKKSRKYAAKLRRESEGTEGAVEVVEEVTRVRSDSDLSSSSNSMRSRTASDDTGYRSSSPADAADKPPEHYDKTTESPETDDGCSDPPDPLSINTHEPGRPDRTPHAIKERLKM